MNPIPFSSVILRDIVSTEEMRSIWSEDNLLRSWIRVEKVVTELQAEAGLIPAEAAREICSRLNLDTLTPARVHDHVRRNRHLMVSFIKAFRAVCGPAAEHFHVGPTTQDILDTALTLQIRDAHWLAMRQTLGLEGALCDRAIEHRDTIMMGRTHEQPALPLTLGFVLGGWAAEVRDHIERAKESEKRWMFGVLTGGVGAQNAFVEMAGEETARRLERMFCDRLGLATPSLDLQTRLDRFAEVVTNLGNLTSTLGRIGLNLRSWQRPEVLETEIPFGAEEYSSSTMPNKRNPESCEQVEGLAALVRCLATAVQGIPVADHRDGVRIPVEYTAIPMSYMMSARALETITRSIRGLTVHKEGMLRNLDHPAALGQAAGERLMIALYKKTGRKDWAHTVLAECSRTSHDDRRPLADVILAHPELSTHFTRQELSRLMDLTTYTGTAGPRTDEAVNAIRRLHAEDLARYAARPAGQPGL
jgi:adenylosuccinate lyase